MGKTRGTLWEIHPVTPIEFWNGTGWQDLGRNCGRSSVPCPFVPQPIVLVATRTLDHNRRHTRPIFATEEVMHGTGQTTRLRRRNLPLSWARYPTFRAN